MFWPWKKQQFNLEIFLKKAAKFDPFEIKKYDELFCHLKDTSVLEREITESDIFEQDGAFASFCFLCRQPPN